jgi:hypothetical protein
MGTEAGRNVFHKDLWVISLLNRAKNKDVVVTDVRFQNEIKYIQDNNGVVVRVKRGPEPVWYYLAEDANRGFSSATMGMSNMGIHKSEWDWIGSEFNYVIDNNGTLQDLGNEVKSMLQFFR